MARRRSLEDVQRRRPKPCWLIVLAALVLVSLCDIVGFVRWAGTSLAAEGLYPQG